MSRRPWVAAAACLLLLVGCAGDDAPSETPETTGSSVPSEEPTSAGEESSPAEPAEPAEPPTVEGEWEELELEPMTSDDAIAAAPLPEALKQYLGDALLEEIIANEEWAEEFPDCPVEADVTAYHPAGFAVVGIAGCGPTGRFGIVASAGEQWEEAVMVGDDAPACSELAEAGVPADVPYVWDGGLRCDDPSGFRYW